MNDIFDIKRFLRQFIVDLRSNAVLVGLSLLILFGVITGLNLLVWRIADTSAGHMAGYTVILFIAIMLTSLIMIFMASRSFSTFHKRAEATPLFMLPCSQIEKFATRFILFVILIPVICVSGIYFIEYGFMSTAIHDVINAQNIPENAISFDKFSPTMVFSLLLASMSSQTVFMTGSIFFSKHPIILTCIILLIIFIVGGTIASTVPDVTEYVRSTFDISSMFSPDSDSDSFSYTGSIIESLVTIALLTGISWIKFKRMPLP